MSHRRAKERRRNAVGAAIPDASGARTDRTAIAWTLSIFVTVFVLLRVGSYVQKSATWDEPVHLTAGYIALADRDYRVELSHPPFARMWAALPLLAIPGIVTDARPISSTTADDWMAGPKPYAFARTFLFQLNDAERLLNAGRFMIVLLGAAAGCLLFSWAYEWRGLRTATLALAFYALTPTIAAHSALITTDAPLMLFFLGATYFLWRACRNPSRRNIGGVAAFTALAIVSKFSGLLLVPVIAIAVAYALWRRMALTPRHATALVLTTAGVAFMTIWAAYGFQAAPNGDSAWTFDVDGIAEVRAAAPTLSAIAGWLDAAHLLPNAFTQGVLFTAVGTKQSAFLLGRISDSGWWYYYPVAFAMKAPLAFLAFLVFGIGVFASRRHRPPSIDLPFILLPLLIYVGVAMVSRVNLGIRHLLPVYPILILIAAVGADWLLSQRSRIARPAVWVLGGIWIARVASIYPTDLSYFNHAVGGASRGFEYLADSNIDWGQDLKRLKRWMTRNGVERVNLAYFGQADPAYYGIDAVPLPGSDIGSPRRPELPGYVAVSVNMLTGVYLNPAWRLYYEGFRHLVPVAHVGNSIRVYWVNTWPEAGGRLQASAPDSLVSAELALARGLTGIASYRHATLHYRRYLQARPADARARASLGINYVLANRLPEGLSVLKEAVSAAPRDGIVRGIVATALLERGLAREAAQHAEWAARLEPRNPDLASLNGRALASEGRFSEAIREFDRALAIDPEHPTARQHRVEVEKRARGG
jgi:4-amino-4-deoxy-L-arabinose transferase-like glycosyltransferase